MISFYGTVVQEFSYQSYVFRMRGKPDAFRESRKFCSLQRLSCIEFSVQNFSVQYRGLEAYCPQRGGLFGRRTFGKGRDKETPQHPPLRSTKMKASEIAVNSGVGKGILVGHWHKWQNTSQQQPCVNDLGVRVPQLSRHWSLGTDRRDFKPWYLQNMNHYPKPRDALKIQCIGLGGPGRHLKPQEIEGSGLGKLSQDIANWP